MCGTPAPPETTAFQVAAGVVRIEQSRAGGKSGPWGGAGKKGRLEMSNSLLRHTGPMARGHSGVVTRSSRLREGSNELRMQMHHARCRPPSHLDRAEGSPRVEGKGRAVRSLLGVWLHTSPYRIPKKEGPTHGQLIPDNRSSRQATANPITR